MGIQSLKKNTAKGGILRYFWPASTNEIGFKGARARLICSFAGLVSAVAILHTLHLYMVASDLPPLFWIFSLACIGVFVSTPAIWQRTENLELATLVLVVVFVLYQNVVVITNQSHLLRQEVFLLGAPVIVILLTGARNGYIATALIVANILCLSLLEGAYELGAAITICVALIAVAIGLSLFYGEVLRKERELMSLREAAEQATKEKSDFLAKMSHEIRTPLNGLSGVFQLLEDTPLTEDQHMLLRTARASGYTLMSLVNDVLDFSKISEQGVTIEPRPTDTKTILETVCQSQEAAARTKNISLATQQDASLPECLNVDLVRVTQVLSNLIGNAIKFSEEGTILCKIETAGTFVKVSVTDQGIGLSHEAQTRIFEKFVQVDSSIYRDYGGTGLGLAICKELVELMGGEIGVKSAPQKGSTFWFTFPLEACQETTAKEKQGNLGRQDYAFDGLKALVVEDNRTNQLIARRFLESMNVEVEIVDDGFPALKSCETTAFDIILMDINLPQMSGVDATKALRNSSGQNKDTPIVALSANIFEEQTSAYMNAGMSACLGKPFKKEKLAELIHDLTQGAEEVIPAA